MKYIILTNERIRSPVIFFFSLLNPLDILLFILELSYAFFHSQFCLPFYILTCIYWFNVCVYVLYNNTYAIHACTCIITIYMYSIYMYMSCIHVHVNVHVHVHLLYINMYMYYQITNT